MLQNLRSFLLRNRFLPFAVLTLFMYVSCSKEGRLAQAISNTNSQAVTQISQVAFAKASAFTGQQLFDGIIFGIGDVAAMIGNTNDVQGLFDSDTEINAFLQVKADLYEDIQAANSDYFDNFKTSMLSNDLNKIKSELKKVGHVLSNIIQANVSQSTLDKIKSNNAVKNIDYNDLMTHKHTQGSLKEVVNNALMQSIDEEATKTKRDDHGSLVVFVLILAIAAIVVLVVVFATPAENKSELYVDELSLDVATNLSLAN